MKKMFALLLAMAMTASIAFTGCGSTPPAETKPDASAEAPAADAAVTPEAPAEDAAATGGKVLTFNLGADPKTLDPNLNSAADGSKVIINEFEGLLRDKYDGKGPQPAMAEAIPEPVNNADGTVTYTFKLRDAKWSDGKPVTASDFQFSFRRIVDPNTAAEYAYIFEPIVNAKEITAGTAKPEELGVKAIDDKTLEITLKHTCDYFYGLLCHQTYLPLREDVVGTDTDGLWAKDPAKIVTNGPFVLTEYTMGDKLVLSKNENYWDAANVKLDKVVMKMIVEQSTALAGFKAGELDVIDSPPVDEVQQLIASGECTLFPFISANFYVINAQTEIEALKNPKVRQAMSMAIDRKQLCENVTRAGEKPAMGIVPFGIPDESGKDFRLSAGDYFLKETAQVEEAKKLLADAGYPNGEGIPEVEVLYNTNEGNKAIAEALQEMWKAIGINCRLENQEWAVFQDTRTNLKYKAVARHGWNGDYADPMTFMDMFTTGNPQSACGYASAEYDKQIEAAAMSQGKEHYDAYRAAEKQMIEDSYIMPLYFNQIKICISPKVTGIGVGAVGKFWFGNADIAE